MGLFNKKEEVPEIPAAPVLPELPKPTTQEEKKGLPELPSFPSNPKTEDINQEIVKSAVIDTTPTVGSEMQVEIPGGLQVTEEQPENLTIPPVPSIQEATPAPTISSPPQESTPVVSGTPSISDISSIPSPPQEAIPSVSENIEPSTITQNKPTTKQTEPIFVRIDKFQSAQKNLETVKESVKEIESVLKRIKDVKSQEEVELKGWTEDVEKIKARLAEVDSDIFNQI